MATDTNPGEVKISVSYSLAQILDINQISTYAFYAYKHSRY